jgi:hypothetical protein
LFGPVVTTGCVVVRCGHLQKSPDSVQGAAF